VHVEAKMIVTLDLPSYSLHTDGNKHTVLSTPIGECLLELRPWLLPSTDLPTIRAGRTSFGEIRLCSGITSAVVRVRQQSRDHVIMADYDQPTVVRVLCRWRQGS